MKLYTFPSSLIVNLEFVQAVWELHHNQFTVVMTHEKLTLTFPSKEHAALERRNFIERWAEAIHATSNEVHK